MILKHILKWDGLPNLLIFFLSHQLHLISQFFFHFKKFAQKLHTFLPIHASDWPEFEVQFLIDEVFSGFTLRYQALFDVLVSKFQFSGHDIIVILFILFAIHLINYLMHYLRWLFLDFRWIWSYGLTLLVFRISLATLYFLLDDM